MQYTLKWIPDTESLTKTLDIKTELSPQKLRNIREDQSIRMKENADIIFHGNVGGKLDYEQLKGKMDNTELEKFKNAT